MKKTNNAKHHWTEADDTAALYVYRFSYHRIAHSRNALANALGIPPGSFGMRIKNFQAIYGDGGLSNYAQQSEAVYLRYRAGTEPELRNIVLKAIEMVGRQDSSGKK